MRRDDRTARRRLDEGIDRIAQLAASLSGSSDSPTPTPDDRDLLHGHDTLPKPQL
jgi:hypothetical protein